MTARGEGESKFEFGGKVWTLRLDFNAMVDFEKATGADFLDTLTAMERGAASMEHVRALFWAMLLDHHPEVTLREAGRMVTAGLAALNAAATSALPVPDAGQTAPDVGGDAAEKPQAA